MFKEYTEGELKSGYYPCIHNLHGKEKGGWGGWWGDHRHEYWKERAPRKH